MKFQARCTWRISECDLYWVSTPIWRMPELTQLDNTKSMMRYLPPKGTAGLARHWVSARRRLPSPPARTSASVLRVSALTDLIWVKSSILLPSSLFISNFLCPQHGSPQAQSGFSNQIDRHAAHDILHTTLGMHGLQEGWLLHPGHNPGGDAASDINSGPGWPQQRQIAQVASVKADKGVQRPCCHGISGIGQFHYLCRTGQRSLLRMPCTREKAIEHLKPGTGHNTLVRYMLPLLPQPAQQVLLHIICRRKIHMATLAGLRYVTPV